jgi:polysaccharide pyruvyl transferase CsaB
MVIIGEAPGRGDRDGGMDTNKQVYRVGISGSYGGLNLGDEAILQSILKQLDRALPVEVTVFSRDPADTIRRHRVARALPVRKMARNEVLPELERLDVLILGGGGILFDAEAKLYLREVQLAHERGVPVFLYAVGAGPLRDASVQGAVREQLERVATVTVRERRARQVLEEAGLHREIHVTADPALLIEPEPLPVDTLRHEGVDPERCLVGISVREPGVAAPDIDERQYHALLADAADYMVDRFDADVVFVPMERQMRDLQHCHAVVSQMLRPQHAEVLKGRYTPGQMISLVSHFSFVLGMRLHFLIFAALAGVPFVALPYASKVSGFLEDLHIEMPPLKLVNAGRLLAYIDQSWDTREALRTQIERALPAVQARARETNKMLVQLLTGEPPAAQRAV